MCQLFSGIAIEILPYRLYSKLVIPVSTRTSTAGFLCFSNFLWEDSLSIEFNIHDVYLISFTVLVMRPRKSARELPKSCFLSDFDLMFICLSNLQYI